MKKTRATLNWIRNKIAQRETTEHLITKSVPKAVSLQETCISGLARPLKHTCDGRRLGLLLSQDGVSQVSQVLQAAVDVQVCSQPV